GQGPDGGEGGYRRGLRNYNRSGWDGRNSWSWHHHDIRPGAVVIAAIALPIADSFDDRSAASAVCKLRQGRSNCALRRWAGENAAADENRHGKGGGTHLTLRGSLFLRALRRAIEASPRERRKRVSDRS